MARPPQAPSKQWWSGVEFEADEAGAVKVGPLEDGDVAAFVAERGEGAGDVAVGLVEDVAAFEPAVGGLVDPGVDVLGAVAFDDARVEAAGRVVPGAASGGGEDEGGQQGHQASILRAARKALCGISTLPNWRMRFLPSFCLSSSLRLRLMSPP